jgi:hypothetical protein
LCFHTYHLTQFLFSSISLPLLHLWIEFRIQLLIVLFWVNSVYLVLLFSSSYTFFYMCVISYSSFRRT